MTTDSPSNYPGVDSPAGQTSPGTTHGTFPGEAGGRVEHLRREGPITRALEERKVQIPNDAFLWAALSSIGLSLTLRLLGRRDDAVFVGQWAPTLLLLGIHNRLAKTGP